MIELTHLGEKLIASILDEPDIRSLISNKVGIDIGSAQVIPEKHLKCCGKYNFDGMHKLDVAILIPQTNKCIAIEAKLGRNRLSKNEFESRFMKPCTESAHNVSRINGSMISILERNFDEELKKELKGQPINVCDEYILEEKWILIARKQVLDSWSEGKGPSLSSQCIKLSFDSLVDSYGGKVKFNTLVRDLIDFDYYAKWFDDL